MTIFRRAIVTVLVPLTFFVVLLAAAGPAAAAAGDVIGFLAYSQPGSTGADVATSVKVDAAGDPIFAGSWAMTSSVNEIITYSMGPTAAFRWERLWAGTGGSDIARDMALDGSGKACIVGVTDTTPAGDADLVLLRYGNDGAPLPARTYNGPADGVDEALAVVCDAAGDCYVAGRSQAADGRYDILVLKYGAAGDLVWAKRTRSPWKTSVSGDAIALRGGAVYVAGTSVHPGHGDDLVLVKYDAASGARRWLRTYDDAKRGGETVSDVIATARAVYVCGMGRFTASSKGTALLVCYSSAGRRSWARSYSGGSGLSSQCFSDLQRSANGDIVTTGYVARAATGQDIVTVAWRPDGRVHWARAVSSTGVRADLGTALDIDGSGRIYVVGSQPDDAGHTHVRVVCYAKSGTRLWSTLTSVSTFGDDQPYDLEVGPDRVWVCGSAWITGSQRDFMMLWLQR